MAATTEYDLIDALIQSNQSLAKGDALYITVLIFLGSNLIVGIFRLIATRRQKSFEKKNITHEIREHHRTKALVAIFRCFQKASSVNPFRERDELMRLASIIDGQYTMNQIYFPKNMRKLIQETNDYYKSLIANPNLKDSSHELAFSNKYYELFNA